MYLNIRRRGPTLWMLFLLGGFGSLYSSEDELPTVSDLQAAYVDQNGGLSTIRALKSIVVYGEIAREDGGVMEFKLYRKRPQFYRIDIQRSRVKMITAHDGENTQRKLEEAGGEHRTVELSDAEVDAIQVSSEFDGPFLQLYGQIESFEVLGVTEVNGAPAYELAVSPDADSPYDRIWLDAENYQEVMLRLRASKGAESEGRETMVFSDFSKVRGVWVAGKIRREVHNQVVSTITIDRVRPNVGLFNSFFERL